VTEILLDMNVVSELIRKDPSQCVVAFIAGCARPIVGPVVFHELAYGIERLRDKVGKSAVGGLSRSRARAFPGPDRRHRCSDRRDERSIARRCVARRQGPLANGFAHHRQRDCAVGDACDAQHRDFERLGIPLIDPCRE
jgi:predicted nucleic acid-binding protein